MQKKRLLLPSLVCFAARKVPLLDAQTQRVIGEKQLVANPLMRQAEQLPRARISHYVYRTIHGWRLHHHREHHSLRTMKRLPTNEKYAHILDVSPASPHIIFCFSITWAMSGIESVSTAGGRQTYQESTSNRGARRIDRRRWMQTAAFVEAKCHLTIDSLLFYSWIYQPCWYANKYTITRKQRNNDDKMVWYSNYRDRHLYW